MIHDYFVSRFSKIREIVRGNCKNKISAVSIIHFLFFLISHTYFQAIFKNNIILDLDFLPEDKYSGKFITYGTSQFKMLLNNNPNSFHISINFFSAQFLVQLISVYFTFVKSIFKI